MKNMTNDKQINSHRAIRFILMIFGTIFLILGIIGIFLPLLPTTPFLLIAVACYSRSSQRFYNWMMHNRWLGPYLQNYYEKKGVPIKVKVGAIIFLWGTILISIILFVSFLLFEILLLIIAILVSLHIVSIKTLQE